MTTPRGLGPPGDSVSKDDDHRYATWDAAYVLGALSAADRREFEAHLTTCPACREAVSELSGMPALLSQLDRDEVAAIGDAGRASPEVSPQLLSSLLATVRRRRRRSRMLAWTGSAAAAVVLAIGVFVGVAGHAVTPPAPQTSVAALPMAQVGTTTLASTVSVSGQRWGTFILMRCVCLAPVYAHHDRLAMVVVGRDGSRTRLATWVAEPGHTATPAASISTPVDQIAAVQVVSADNGTVLLERGL
ncbi:MAG: zf-HC2 domain-containing protein [Mycobacterium sp.]|uniref:anti-sigma factor family protein n=1 Tax=Mycobacterium sp. TaxID=1785 RepID=UPI00260BEA68|nr:zf-HC2 domain-containing protein [Mycobacterium sp.]MDI3314667.1 zf-HC2 domain-containing protein [Mycobacterium sp.]